MAQNIMLVNDPSKLDSISSMRVMVAVPLLYIFMTHYLFQILRKIKGQTHRRLKLDDQGRRLFLYGVAGLFSINYTQYTPFIPVMAWATLVCVILNHCFVFLKEIQERYRNYGILVYYTMLFLWFLGIIFMHVFNST